jgi:hypothetical protein
VKQEILRRLREDRIDPASQGVVVPPDPRCFDAVSLGNVGPIDGRS